MIAVFQAKHITVASGPTAAAHSDGVNDRFAATADYFLLQTTLKGVTVIDYVPFREGALWSFNNQ